MNNFDITSITYFNVQKKNGGAIFAKNMHSYLDQLQGVNSEIFYPSEFREIERKLVDSDTNITRQFFFKRLLHKILKKLRFDILTYILQCDFNAFKLSLNLLLHRKMQNKNGQILLFHDHITLYYFSLFFNLKKYRIVLIMHNNGSPSEMITIGIKNKIKVYLLDLMINLQLERVVKKASRIVFLCSDAQNIFQEKHNVGYDKCIVIPNGIKDIPVLDKADLQQSSTIRFITVGALNERKGLDLFIDCLPLLVENFKDKIEFVIIGNGKYFEELQMLSRKYKNLKVIGETDNVESYLRDSDVFFLLSRNEGQPLSILEAMRAGLLILSTDVGCNSSMIKGDSGILVKPLKDEILQAFDRIVINWDSFKDNGHLSRELFRKKFTEEIMYSSYLKLFNSIA